MQIRFVRSTKYLKLEAFMTPTFTKFFSGCGCDTAGLESQVSETGSLSPVTRPRAQPRAHKRFNYCTFFFKYRLIIKSLHVVNARREVEIKLCDPAGLPWGKGRWHLWNRKLGGTQSRSRYFEETENMLKVCYLYEESNQGSCIVQHVSWS